MKVSFILFVPAIGWNVSVARQVAHLTQYGGDGWCCIMGLHVLNLHFLTAPPLLAHGPAVISTAVGQPLSIPCMMLDGIPLPERYWSHNGKPVMWLLSCFYQNITQVITVRVHAWQRVFFVGWREWKDFPEEWWQPVCGKSCRRGCWDICLHRSKHCRLQKYHSQCGDSR